MWGLCTNAVVYVFVKLEMAPLKCMVSGSLQNVIADRTAFIIEVSTLVWLSCYIPGNAVSPLYLLDITSGGSLRATEMCWLLVRTVTCSPKGGIICWINCLFFMVPGWDIIGFYLRPHCLHAMGARCNRCISQDANAQRCLLCTGTEPAATYYNSKLKETIRSVNAPLHCWGLVSQVSGEYT